MNGQLWRRDENNNFIDFPSEDAENFQRMRKKVKALGKRKRLSTDIRLVPFSRSIGVVSANLPDFMNSVILNHSNEYGRHFRSNADITPCRKIGECKAFAAVIDKCEHPYCLTCHQSIKRFITCTVCGMVAFCNATCRKNNKSHRYECGSIFHSISFGSDIEIKLAIQLVLKSLSIYEGNVLRHSGF